MKKEKQIIDKTCTKEECMAVLKDRFPNLQIKSVSELKTGYSYNDPQCTDIYCKYNYVDVIGIDPDDQYHINCLVLYSAGKDAAIGMKVLEYSEEYKKAHPEHSKYWDGTEGK